MLTTRFQELRRREAEIRNLRPRVRVLQSMVEAGHSIPEYTEYLQSFSPLRTAPLYANVEPVYPSCGLSSH